MTLKEVIRLIEASAAEQYAVRAIVREDIFRINSVPDVRYGVFCSMQQQHRESSDGIVTLNMVLYYVDRLTEDKSNAVDIQSTGMQVLSNVIRRMADHDVIAGSWNMTPFTQKFADECAGIFCTVAFDYAADTACPVEYASDNNYESNVQYIR